MKRKSTGEEEREKKEGEKRKSRGVHGGDEDTWYIGKRS